MMMMLTMAKPMVMITSLLEMEIANVDENILLALVWFGGLVDWWIGGLVVWWIGARSLCEKFLANNADANVLRTFSLGMSTCICVIVFV